jgi:serine-type D-Ala-D-Ala carboxypeptidase (penicillin-binding protein 5/6)
MGIIVKIEWSDNLKKFTAILLIIFIMLYNIPTLSAVKASEKYKAAVLVEANTGKILYEYNKDEVLPQASITKVMTYYVIKDFFSQSKVNYSDKVKVNINQSSIPSDGSRINLKNGDEITIRDLVDSMLIVSANDSALQLENMYDEKTKSNILNDMNTKAKELGLKNTYYINTSGLTEEVNGTIFNKTTAYETAILSMKLINEYPETLDITSKKDYVYKGLRYENTNKLLKSKQLVDGLKTGHTDEAGYCLVSTEDLTKSNGNGKPLRLIAVILGSETQADRTKESIKLLEYGEKNFSNEIVIKKDSKFQMKSEYYKAGYIEGTVLEDVYMLKKKDEKIIEKIEFNNDLPSNIKKGDVIGKVVINNSEGNSVKSYDLYASKDFKSASIFKKFILLIRQIFNKS